MRQNKKKKLKNGAFMEDLLNNKGAVGGVGNMIGSSISAGPSPSRGASVGGGALSGAATGFQIGGPVGAGIGAVAGGIKGWLDADANEDAITASKRAQESSNDKFLLNNARMKHGGKILAKNLNVQEGGRLNAISDNAVEVQANNPNETDSVELDNAYVDNDEVIDRQNRVFSDSIFLPNGKSIAKEAKRLEKQKAEDYDVRFKAANERIEGKLDSLFNYQESTKGPKEMNNFKKGGIYIKPENRGKFNATKAATGETTEELTHSSNPVTKKRAIFAQNAAKWHHAVGGRLSNHNDSWVLPNVSSLLNNSSLIGQGISAKLIQRTQGKYDKADFKKGGSLKPALYYTPLKGSVGHPKKRLGLGGPGPGTPDPRRVAIDAQMSKNYPGIALDLLDRHNKPVTPGVPDNPATAAIRKGFPATMPMIDPYSQKQLSDVNATDFDQTGLQGISLNKGITAKGPGMKRGGKLKPSYDLGTPNLGGKLGQMAAGKKKTNWNNIATQAATFAPNLVNSSLQSRLTGPPAPQLENASRLERVDPSAQLAQIDTDANQANAILTSNTSQAGVLASGLGANLSRKLQAKNQVMGQNQQINAGIQGNETFINAQKQARNADRVTGQRLQNVEFNNKKAELSSQNVSNLSQKILMQGKERNVMNLDAQKYGILMQQYNNLPPLMKAKYSNVFDFYNSTAYKEGQKKGGRIRKNGNRGTTLDPTDVINLSRGGRMLDMKNC